MSKALLQLQMEIEAASKLPDVRYDSENSLQDNVTKFSLDPLTTAFEKTAPNFFSVLVFASFRCARSGRAREAN